MKEPKELTISLQRNLLGSISLEDIENKLETEAERREYCAAIFAVYPRLEKKLKKMLYTQLMFSANEADTWEKVIFGRGTFNGIDLLLEDFKIASAEYQAEASEEKEENKGRL